MPFCALPEELHSAAAAPIFSIGFRAVRPQLAAVLKLRAGVSADHLILPRLCDRRTILDWHHDLQLLAGLRPVEMQPPKGWRRTHGQMMAELGLANAEKLASVSLDHGG